MLQFDAQEHVLPNEPALGTRIRDAGYNFRTVSENIYAFAESHFHGHAGFVIDWGEGPGGIQDPPGHRINIMDPDVIEVGISVLEDLDPRTMVGPLLVTQDFGQPRRLDDPQIVGVVWRDLDRNGIYDPGEGYSNVAIEVRGASQTWMATTMTAGGYQVRVPDGTYDVVASGSGLDSELIVSSITVAGSNVKADFEVATANRRPIASADSVSVSEDGLVTIPVLDNDTDADGSLDATTVTVTAPPTSGTVTVNETNGRINYRPNTNFFGSDFFRYTVRDSNGAVSDEAGVTVTVKAVNDAPVAQSVAIQILEDTSAQIGMLDLVTDVDSVINWSSFEASASPDQGQLTFRGSDRSLLYTPQGNAVGTIVITYRVADTQGAFSQNTQVTVAITPVNDAPTASPDLFAIISEGPAVLAVTRNDKDVDSDLRSARLVIVGPPAYGSAIPVGDTIHYVSEAGYVGMDVLSYVAIDDLEASSAPAVVKVYVTDPQAPWQNPVQAVDVDANEQIGPLDAIVVINNLGQSLALPSVIPGLPQAPPPFLDVDGNRILTPLDALLVINRLETPNEGEAPLSAGGNNLDPPRRGSIVEPISPDRSTITASDELASDQALSAPPPFAPLSTSVGLIRQSPGGRRGQEDQEAATDWVMAELVARR
jgi:hypothetical protein